MTGTPLWTSDDAARATGGRCDTSWTCSGIASDSRRIEQGDLFVALEGPSFDGHDFVAAALQDGAAAAMVSDRPDGVAGRTAPQGVKVYSPAFDVTPARLITAIITEKGIVRPPFEIRLKELVAS